MDIINLVIGVMILACLLVIACCFLALHRNKKVWKERTRVINLISELSQRDWIEGREWRWRYDSFNEWGSHTMMVHSFWIPVHKFYEDAPFLKEFKN